MSGNGQGIIVITGASTGIGRACALDLDRRGYRVFAGVRRQQDGDDLRAEASSRLTPIMLDVTDRAQIAQAADQVREQAAGRGIHGLINNAGIVVPGPLEIMPLDLFEQQLQVNVVGLVAVSQAFLPALRTARGRIVNISSDNGRTTWPYLGAYCASKHAIEALSDSLRMELLPWRIPVIVVEPGSIVTPIWEKSTALGQKLRENLTARGQELYGEAFQRLEKSYPRSPAPASRPRRSRMWSPVP